MPLDWRALYTQAEAKVREALQRAEQQAQDLTAALALLQSWSPDEARARVRAILETYTPLSLTLRTAWPIEDDLALAQGRCPYGAALQPRPYGRACPPAEAPRWPVRAADGSQISPDHHAAVYYGLVNLAAVHMAPGQTPYILRRTELFSEADLATKENDAAFIAGYRDVHELALLGEPGPQGQRPDIGLLDGPLEFWRRGTDQDATTLAQQYQDLLQDLVQRQGILIAGYVDRPRSATVVRMLALLDMYQAGRLPIPKPATEPGPSANDVHQHWPNLTDAALWQRVLAPGQRSPIFRTWVPVAAGASPGRGTHPHFFYLRLPHGLARVDIPEAVAYRPEAVDRLHQTLWHQVHIIPDRFYPYVLVRAHEEAVVRYREREQVEALLVRLMVTHQQQLALESEKKRTKRDTAA